MLWHSGDPGSTDIPKVVYLARQSKSRSIKEGQERATIDNVGLTVRVQRRRNAKHLLDDSECRHLTDSTEMV